MPWCFRAGHVSRKYGPTFNAAYRLAAVRWSESRLSTEAASLYFTFREVEEGSVPVFPLSFGFVGDPTECGIADLDSELCRLIGGCRTPALTAWPTLTDHWHEVDGVDLHVISIAGASDQERGSYGDCDPAIRHGA
jgi:hypothetical protein